MGKNKGIYSWKRPKNRPNLVIASMPLERNVIFKNKMLNVGREHGFFFSSKLYGGDLDTSSLFASAGLKE